MTDVAAATAALVFSAVAPFALRPLLTRLGVLDVPNSRSSHTRPTLRGGGIAPWIGVLGGGVVILMQGGPNLRVTPMVLAAALAIGAVGLVEDLRGIRAGIRALLQFAVGMVLALALGAGSSWGIGGLVLLALMFTANVNFTNFMDGVNAISGLHGFVAGLAYAVVGYVSGQGWMVTVGAILAAAFVVFLPWNLVRPGMFLGDVGSYLLGGLTGGLLLGALVADVTPIACVAPVAIYWADTATTILRRALRGEPVFQAHRSHAYQRLTGTGLSHVGVSGVVGAFTVLASAIGVLAAAEQLPWWVATLAITLLCGLYLSLPRWRGDRTLVQATYSLPRIPEPAPVPPVNGWAPTQWAVVGASGFVGSQIVSELSERGLEVVPVVAPRLDVPTPESAHQLADLARERISQTELSQQLRGADVVINAAGLASPSAAPSAALWGANALLPSVVALAAEQAGVRRCIHMSSAAVQGARPILDASTDVRPFSPYSLSKALGEQALLALVEDARRATEILIVRATSVQGTGRRTTSSLRRVARSWIASVAAPGDQPSTVSSVGALADFVCGVGIEHRSLPRILLQPWEGLSVAEVLTLAGGRVPRVLPRWLCRASIRLGRVACAVLPKLSGAVRRVEVMWFGQPQQQGPKWFVPSGALIADVLSGGDSDSGSQEN